MISLESFLEKHALNVRKPLRYISIERNRVVKDWSATPVRFVVVYPDVYEVGMNNLSVQIIYSIINSIPNALCERAFLPGKDVVELMLRKGVELFSLENRKPLREFDVIAFTVSSEMVFTNILKILELSNINIFSRDRRSLPLVTAGGSSILNPSPLKPFIDVFAIGDAEVLIPKLVDIVHSVKKRNELLQIVSREEGFYVPLVDSASQVTRVYSTRLARIDRPVVPILETVHDRLSVEIARGCLRGCRFCQAGYVYRPYREKSVDEIYSELRNAVSNTGFTDVGFLSLSVSDYSEFPKLLNRVTPYLHSMSASLSLPSMRVDMVGESLSLFMQTYSTSTFTIAPEVGSDRLSDIVNKGLKREMVLRNAEALIKSGWQKIKFYFMIGLPFESEEDVMGIAELLREMKIMARALKKRVRFSASINTFSPKPHTPFQWGRFIGIEKARHRMRIIKDNTPSNIALRFHSPESSLVESLYATGGDGVSDVVLEAFRKGAFMDSWQEFFLWDVYSLILSEFDTDFLFSGRSVEDSLPWDNIDVGVSRRFLVSEFERAKKGLPTGFCREEGCVGCGICTPEMVRSLRPVPPRVEIGVVPHSNDAVAERYLVEYGKVGEARFISHKDLQRVFIRAFASLMLPVAYSSGYNRKPRIAFSPAIPVGVESESEFLIVCFREFVGMERIFKLNEVLPDGIFIKGVSTTGHKSVEKLIDRIVYSTCDGRIVWLCMRNENPFVFIKRSVGLRSNCVKRRIILRG